MNMPRFWLLLNLLLCSSFAVNLQPADYLFFSTHKNPTQVVSDSKYAYILTEGGILVYDYRRQNWIDNIILTVPVSRIKISKERGTLLVDIAGKTLEYNSTFHRLTDAFSNVTEDDATLGKTADLNGLMLNNNYVYLGDAIRDKYMRRSPVVQARVFDYDNLWMLTQGMGLFQGSARRKEANSMWFGLDQNATFSIYADDKNFWFGSSKDDGALVRASQDLNNWSYYPSTYESGFPNGCVRDIIRWKDYLWLATNRGVVRMEPKTNQYKFYSHFQGGTELKILSLHVHEDQLYAGTEQGLSKIAGPQEDFQNVPMPRGDIAIAVLGMASKDKDLWVGTQYGLYMLHDQWKSLDELSKTSVKNSINVPVPAVKYQDTTLYWLALDKIMAKPKKVAAKILLERESPFKLFVDDKFLFVAYKTGVTVYNLKTNLWTDFTLSDGIPGNQVLSLAVQADKLWIGTDLGIMRINARQYYP